MRVALCSAAAVVRLVARNPGRRGSRSFEARACGALGIPDPAQYVADHYHPDLVVATLDLVPRPERLMR